MQSDTELFESTFFCKTMEKFYLIIHPFHQEIYIIFLKANTYVLNKETQNSWVFMVKQEGISS